MTPKRYPSLSAARNVVRLELQKSGMPADLAQAFIAGATLLGSLDGRSVPWWRDYLIGALFDGRSDDWQSLLSRGADLPDSSAEQTFSKLPMAMSSSKPIRT
jgi:hypothetical protein